MAINKTTITNHTVILTLDDVKPVVAANLATLDLNTVEIRPPSSPDGRRAELVFPLQEALIDSLLRVLIPELPKTYKRENLFGNGNLVAKITWTD